MSLPNTVLESEHRSRASLILSKLKVVVDTHVHSDGLYIQVIGADEGKGPVLLLSDSISQWTPLLLAIRFPLLGPVRDLHPLE